jgi:hypothetical protein
MLRHNLNSMAHRWRTKFCAVIDFCLRVKAWRKLARHCAFALAHQWRNGTPSRLSTPRRLPFAALTLRFGCRTLCSQGRTSASQRAVYPAKPLLGQPRSTTASNPAEAPRQSPAEGDRKEPYRPSFGRNRSTADPLTPRCLVCRPTVHQTVGRSEKCCDKSGNSVLNIDRCALLGSLGEDARRYSSADMQDRAHERPGDGWGREPDGLPQRFLRARSLHERCRKSSFVVSRMR